MVRNSAKKEEFEKPHKHEKALMLLGFLISASVGYFLTHYVALFGA
jgi:hypothetical protein